MNGADRIPLPLAIPYEDVLHFLGYPAGRGPTARVDLRTRALLAEARTLSQARGCYSVVEPERAAELDLETVAAEKLVIGLVTVGEAIERRASELLAAGDSMAALLLDAAGSAAAEEAADCLGSIIAGQSVTAAARAPERAAALSCRISPGYGAWPLEAQSRLFALLPHDELGVELLPSLLMKPRKSISFAMWLGADARPVAGLSGCATCRLENCRYRKEAGPGGPPP